MQHILGHLLSQRDRTADDRRQYEVKYVTKLVWAVVYVLQSSFRCFFVEILYHWERANYCLWHHLLSYVPPTKLYLKKGNWKLYRRLNNTLAVYFTTTQSKRSHSTKHLLSPSWWRGGNSAHTVPFQLISDKGKVLHNHQVSGCKTAVSEVQAQDANHISLCLS